MILAIEQAISVLLRKYGCERDVGRKLTRS
jgi:hypothetical protein